MEQKRKELGCNIKNIWHLTQKKVYYVYLLAVSGIISTSNLVCKSIWSTDNEAGTKFFEALKALYDKWFFPLLMVNGIFFALTKDEKRKGILKNVCICLIVVYLLFGLKDVVVETLVDMQTWFK